MKEPKDTFSISLAETEKARQLLRGMVQDLSDRFPTLRRQEVAQPQPESTTSQAAASNNQSAVPLNAANLQQQQQQLSKIHQRSASRTTQTPAAPTSSQPPFPFGSGSSPHGTPAYIGKIQVTQDDLRLPPRKKARPTNNAPVPTNGTPGSNTSAYIRENVEIGEQPPQGEIILKPQQETVLPKSFSCMVNMPSLDEQKKIEQMERELNDALGSDSKSTSLLHQGEDIDFGVFINDNEALNEREIRLVRMRKETRRRRQCSGTVQWLNLAQGIGSDTDDASTHPAVEGANEARSSAKRLKRKGAENRTNPTFDDSPPRVDELEEPDSELEAAEDDMEGHSIELENYLESELSHNVQMGDGSLESSTSSSHSIHIAYSTSQDHFQENFEDSTKRRRRYKYDEPDAWLEDEDTTQLWWRAFEKLRTDNLSAYQYLEVAANSNTDGCTKSFSRSSRVSHAFQHLSEAIGAVREGGSLNSVSVASSIDRFCNIVEVVGTTLSFKTGAVAWVGLCGAMTVY
jgi:hypothetical protein